MDLNITNGNVLITKKCCLTTRLPFDIFIKHILDKSGDHSISQDYLKYYSAFEKNSLIDLTIKKSHSDLLEGKKLT